MFRVNRAIFALAQQYRNNRLNLPEPQTSGQWEKLSSIKARWFVRFHAHAIGYTVLSYRFCSVMDW